MSLTLVVTLRGRVEELENVRVYGAWPGNRTGVGTQIAADKYSVGACVSYYPQLFTGHWIPRDTSAKPGYQATPVPGRIAEESTAWINQRDRPVYIGP